MSTEERLERIEHALTFCVRALKEHRTLVAPSILPHREFEVVRQIALGYNSREIAQQLHLSERTVKTYKARACERLQKFSRPELTEYALTHGLIG